MKWPKFYLAAIVVHLLVLFGLTWHFAIPVPPPEKHYLEVTLEAPPPPASPTAPAVPTPAPPQPTTELGLSPSKETDNPNATPSDTASNKPPSPPEAMARTPMAPTPDIPDSDMTRQAADKAGPDTPGVIGGSDSTGPTGGGGGMNPYKVVAVPEGISWQDAEVAALAWGGRLAVLNSEKEEQFVFKLADEPKYWRDTDNGTLGPWLGGDFRYQPRYNPSLAVNFSPETIRGVFNGSKQLIPLYVKYNWGILFRGPVAGQRQSNPVATEYGEIANGYVVKFSPIPLRKDDTSIAKGHLGTHTFEVFAVPPQSPGINWLDAEEQAHARGGYLAIIRTAEENSFVYNLTLEQAGAWGKPIEGRGFGTHGDSAGSRQEGPWLGGYKLFDKEKPNPHVRDVKPDGWRWFHFASSPDATGLSDDSIININLNNNKFDYPNFETFGGLWPSAQRLQPVMALHYVKISSETGSAWGHLNPDVISFAAWDMMKPVLRNRGYVVEYDDPPVTAAK